jgi:hypothetical protein
MCRKLTQNLKLAPEVDLEAIARSTEGLTGADLKALLYTAQLGGVPHRNRCIIEDQALSPSQDSAPSLCQQYARPARGYEPNHTTAIRLVLYNT